MRPVIFLSAATRELKSARQLVANTLTFLGYEPEWEDIFDAGEGDLLGVLRRRIDASAGVVQIIGRTYGAEPAEPDATFDRVSYTQYEALYARQRGKKVWYLLLDDTFPADPCEPEPEEKAQLQRGYRERVHGSNDLWHPIKDRAELESRALKLRDELAHLRRGAKRWAALVLALLVLVAGGVFWLNRGQHRQDQRLIEIDDKSDKLLQALRDFPQTLTQQQSAGEKEDDAAQQARAFAALEKKYGLPAGSLATELPRFAEQLLQRADTSALDRANALFVQKNFVDAERAALEAKDKALAAAGQPVHDAIEALEVAGWSAQKQIQYARALEHFRAAAALTNRERDSLEWARVQYAIASVLFDLGRAREREPILREVAALHERMLGPEHSDTLRSRNDLANALRDLGKSAEAEQEYRDVLAVRERVLGPEHRDTLATRNNLAVLLQDQGKSVEAEQEHRAVLAVRERTLGPEHPHTLQSRNNLANALGHQGKSAEAEQEYRAVLALSERVLGPEHPDTLGSRNNLATALAFQGKYAEAEQEYRAVLAVRERVLGPEHPDIYRSHSALAAVLQSQSKHSEAEAIYKSVIPFFERVLGPEHPYTLSNRDSLAYVLHSQGKYAEAEREYRAVLAVRERVLGPEHVDTLSSRNNLARTLQARREYAQAEQEYRAVLAVRERVLGMKHQDVFGSCFDLALVLGAQGKFADALAFAQRARDGREEVFGGEHPYSKNAKGLCEDIEAEMKKK